MKDHQQGCPRLQFWDAGEWEAQCLCKEDEVNAFQEWLLSPDESECALHDPSAAERVFCIDDLRAAWNAAVEACAEHLEKTYHADEACDCRWNARNEADRIRKLKAASSDGQE